MLLRAQRLRRMIITDRIGKNNQKNAEGILGGFSLWTKSKIYDIIIKKFQLFSKSVSIWVKAFNEVQTSEQTRCRKNHN